MSASILQFPVRHNFGLPRELSIVQLACLDEFWRMYRITGTKGDGKWHITAMLMVKTPKYCVLYLADATTGLFRATSLFDVEGLEPGEYSAKSGEAIADLMRRLSESMGDVDYTPAGIADTLPF